MGEQTIEVDMVRQPDPDYVEESECSTESLTSSIFDYQYENGRRYHAFQEGKYAFPNDEKEQDRLVRFRQSADSVRHGTRPDTSFILRSICLRVWNPDPTACDRLDVHHHIISIMLDGELHLAPIDSNPQKILDVGTGTGIWAIDAGEFYPSAEVIGTDISPIQPNWVPPNVQFQIDDAEKEWTWPLETFDLIHMRHLGGAIEDWQRLFRQSFEALKPGGWIDICEFDMDFFSDDGSLTKESNMTVWAKKVQEATAKSGRLFITSTIPSLLETSGFQRVHSKLFKQPVGTWAADRKLKEIGAFTRLMVDTGFEAIGIALFTRVLGMEVDVAEALIQGSIKESKDRKVHSYAVQHFYCAQKPLDD